MWDGGIEGWAKTCRGAMTRTLRWVPGHLVGSPSCCFNCQDFEMLSLGCRCWGREGRKRFGEVLWVRLGWSWHRTSCSLVFQPHLSIDTTLKIIIRNWSE